VNFSPRPYRDASGLRAVPISRYCGLNTRLGRVGEVGKGRGAREREGEGEAGGRGRGEMGLERGKAFR
jgi:hypothetical protein